MPVGSPRVEVTLDCVDLDRVATFWAAALRYERTDTVPGRYVSLQPVQDGNSVTLALQRVPDPKLGKNRMHLDLLVPELEPEVRRLEELGATRTEAGPREEFGTRWAVLADPEGNEFCVGLVR